MCVGGGGHLACFHLLLSMPFSKTLFELLLSKTGPPAPSGAALRPTGCAWIQAINPEGPCGERNPNGVLLHDRQRETDKTDLLHGLLDRDVS